MPDRMPLDAGDPLDLGRPLRVLVVDDDDDTRDMFQMLLTSLGWHVATAGSGAEALERFDPTEIDFILTDIGLPEMDGCALLERLRERAHVYVPAIAVTGYGGEDAAARVRDAGFDGHLTKPFHLAALVELLREIGAKRSK